MKKNLMKKILVGDNYLFGKVNLCSQNIGIYLLNMCSVFCYVYNNLKHMLYPICFLGLDLL